MLVHFVWQHLEDNAELRELTKYKPHVLLTQENTQIKDLQQENKGRILFGRFPRWVVFVLTLWVDFLLRIMAVSWRTPVRSGTHHGSVPQADAAADDGKEGAGHQTGSEPPPGLRQSTASFTPSLCSVTSSLWGPALGENSWRFYLSLQEVQNKVEQICEMGQVMRRAVQVDDQHYCSVRERLAQLEVSTDDRASFPKRSEVISSP